AGTDVEVSERSRPGRGSFADVRSSAQGARVDRVGRYLRSWARAAHGPGRRAGTLRLFTLHDLWLLSRGVSAIRRLPVHWSTGDRAGASLQHASVGSDESRGAFGRDHAGERHSELRQRAELREGLSDEYPADACDL